MPSKIEISPAPEVEKIGQSLIGAHHPYLAEVGILYLFTNQDRKEDRKPTAATISKLSPMQRFLVSGSTREGEEYCILVNLPLWRSLTKPQQRALVDHELLHLREEEPDPDDEDQELRIVWSAGHDVMLFADEVRRHGAWNADIQMVAQQLRLFEEDPGRQALRRRDPLGAM